MKPLDTCVDSYAIAYATGNAIYGHIRIHIHNTICRDYYRSDSVLSVTCQIGSNEGDESMKAPYAFSYGVEFQPLILVTFRQLDTVTKYMRRFEKKFDKYLDELGSPASFSEIALRVLVCSGVDRVFVNPNYNPTERIYDGMPCYTASEKTLLRLSLENLESILKEKFK